MIRLSVFLLPVLSLLFPVSAAAVCPLCTVAVGVGVGLSRWLGIDDTITGVWVGGLVVSSALWTAGWISKKKLVAWQSEPWVLLGFYLVVVLPLVASGVVGHPLNQLWGVDKLLLGVIIGSLLFGASLSLGRLLRLSQRNFPYQKVVLPVLLLSLGSLLFYLFTR